MRTSAILKAPGDERALGDGGTLYQTSRRVVHIGQAIVNVQLSDIVQRMILSVRALMLPDAEGRSVDNDRPRDHRIEIGAVMGRLRP